MYHLPRLLLACSCLQIAAGAVANSQEPERLELEARVIAHADVRVKARVDGHVARVFVDVGESVDALAKLVVLSAPELHAETGRTSAILAEAGDRLEVLRAELEIGRKQLAIVQRAKKMVAGELATAEQLLNTGRAQFNAAKAMFENGALGSQEMQQRKAAMIELEAGFTSAGERVKNAENQLEIAKLELARRDLEIVAARTRVNVKRAAHELAKVRAEFATIVNVLPGARVVESYVGKGDMVRAGETALLRLVDDRRLHLRAAVPLEYAHLIRPGEPVTVRHPRTGETVSAKVSRMSGIVDESGTMAVEVDIDNDGSWIPGTRATIEVDLTPR